MDRSDVSDENQVANAGTNHRKENKYIKDILRNQNYKNNKF